MRQDSTQGAQSCLLGRGHRRGPGGAKTSTVDEDLPIPEQAVLAVLYAPGARPSIDAVRRAAEASGAFAVTFDPGERLAGGVSRGSVGLGSVGLDEGEFGGANPASADRGEIVGLVAGEVAGDGGGADVGGGSGDPRQNMDWAELLITGLTFDLAGLAPGAGEVRPAIAQRFGLAENLAVDKFEAVLLRPGAHLAGAAAMLPVVRGCVALGSALAMHTAATAVVWLPARTIMAPDYFAAITDDWLSGGAFPALGLTSLVPGGSGLVSHGLAFFTGQEIDVAGSDLAHAGRIAIRMVHTLVSHGRLTAPIELAGPDGEPLRAAPSVDGTLVRVWAQL